MRILVIGSGSIAHRHVANLQAMDPDASFILLRRGARRDAWSDGLGATVTGDVSAALAEHPDCALVCTPSALHVEALLPLIAAGLPLYVEKPVVTSRDGIERVRGALRAARYQAPSLAGCNLRFLPSLQRMRSLLREGSVGAVVRATFEAGQWLPDWRPQQDYRRGYSAQSALGGGVVFDLVHELDAARWFFGGFDRVRAILGRFSGLQIDSEDCAAILLGRDHGPVVSIGLDYVSRRPVRHYEVVGTEGSLRWDLTARSLERVRADCVDVIDCGEHGFDVAETYRSAVREFVTALETGADTSQDIHEGLASAELAMRVKEAALA
jgi:predicted dehydrogenase